MNIDFLKFFLDKEFTFPRISTLVILIFGIFGIMITIVIPYLIKLYPSGISNYIQLSLLFLPNIVITIVWYYYRSVFPKCSKKKNNIIIAIETENLKQKIRISKDFVDKIESQLNKFELGNEYDIVVLNNPRAIRFKNLTNSLLKIPEKDITNSNELLRFESASNKMNARFCVLGDLRIRNSPNHTYILNINAFIRHRPLTLDMRNNLQEDFNQIWENQLSFLESEETTGFKSTSDQVFFAASYMLALTLYLDLCFEQGISMLTKLLKCIDENDKFERYRTKVNFLLSSGYYIFSKYLYMQGEIDKSVEFRRKYLNIKPDDYDSHLIEAIHHVERNDPEIALEFVYKAKTLARDDGTWRYSEFYILILLKKYKEALRVLDQILKYSFSEETDIISQVITYNLNRFEKNPNHIQSYFIIGVLIYKKLNNIPDAHEKLEIFLSKSKDNEDWNILRKRAESYVEELNVIMNLGTEME